MLFMLKKKSMFVDVARDLNGTHISRNTDGLVKLTQVFLIHKMKGSINVASSDSHKMADKKVEIEEESLTEADENPTSVDSNSAEVPYDLQSFI